MKLSALTKSKKILVIICIGVFIGVTMQFSSPEITNPPVVSEINAPDEVRTILERACYDCHSNESRPAWIDQIAPVSYLVASDIKEARSRFNLSDWNNIPKAKQEVLLWEIVNAIEQGEMPLKSYLAVHPAAKITNDELNILKRYVNTLPGRKQVDTTQIISNTHQTAVVVGTRKVPTSLNGISYSSDYKNWKVISSTDKYDSGTMRVVYGNDIMVKALQNGTMPFPDGAKIVKAVWNVKREDKNGNVFPANFVNVQIMLKDRKRFKNTEGWGFAKFDGLDLLPYEKTVNYATACINCHRLLVPENDFVFNIPTKYTVKPTLAPETIYNSQGKKVIGSLFNNHLGTLSILYGNGPALQRAGQPSNTHATGEVFTLVTWKQKPMPGWYGSDINGSMESIETVSIVPDKHGSIGYSYNLQKKGINIPARQVSNKQERMDFIINQSTSVFP